MSIAKQCELLDVSRSWYYYKPLEPNEKVDQIMLKCEVKQEYIQHPFYGYRRIANALSRKGVGTSRKQVRALMKKMGLQAIYPKPRLSIADKGHKNYPYLLRGVSILRPNQVWSTDITYIRFRHGFVYLAAIMDWFSRYVVSWALSITLEADFCVDMLKTALETTRPEIFNSDQGSQFTSEAFTAVLEKQHVQISMDGRGRAFDNIFVERLWRSVKYEEVFLKDYSSVWDAKNNLRRYFDFYNRERPHQSLGYKTPAEIYYAGTEQRNLTCLQARKDLMQSSVGNNNNVLSYKSLHVAPQEQSHGGVHLKN